MQISKEKIINFLKDNIDFPQNNSLQFEQKFHTETVRSLVRRWIQKNPININYKYYQQSLPVI